MAEDQQGVKRQESDGGDSSWPRGTSLKEVVAFCEKQWFQEYLKAAEEGNCEMQMLVGQMLMNGYGAPRNLGKGRYWLEKAARSSGVSSGSVT